MLRSLALPLMLFAMFLPAQAASFELRFERLTEALSGLGEKDRTVVERAISSIKKGENTIALTQLSSLNMRYPMNSSLRILTAYALLETGNLLGAFDEARKAEEATGGNSYKCWFLAKIAFLAGDNAVCKREIAHAKTDSKTRAAAQALEKELAAK